MKAEIPLLDPRSVGEVEEQLHLQAVKQKVRRPGMTNSKRKDRAVRLYKMCLRMTQTNEKGQKASPKHTRYDRNTGQLNGTGVQYGTEDIVK